MVAINLRKLFKNLTVLKEHYRSEFLSYHNPGYPAGMSREEEEFFQSFLEDHHIEKKSFKIGEILVKNPVISAPLAGISDNTYRIFAKAFGSALTYTEMVSSYGLHYDHRESFFLATISDFEKPCGVQLFGSEPRIMVDAAIKIEEYADFIDINMGCPVPKVLKTKSGGYLLKDEKRISEIISGITSKIKKPLTVKLRLGWDKNSINVVKVAKIAENAGASAIAVHGRTVRQGFSGNVDYIQVKKVKENVSIPVILSGDVNGFKKAIEVMKFTGCDGVMIGRASKGMPWIFFNIAAGIAVHDFYERHTGAVSVFDFNGDFIPSLKWKKDLAMLYLMFMVYFKGEEKAVREFRKYVAWIFKGTRGITRLKQDFFLMETLEAAIDKIEGSIDI